MKKLLSLLLSACLTGLMVIAFIAVINNGTCSGTSMNPTLKENSIVFYNRFSCVSELERGDIVAFKIKESDPHAGGVNAIKRIIGIPGDTVEFDGYNYYINGQLLVPNGYSVKNKEYDEDEGKWVVPAGHYFVAGDNYESSYDSRNFGVIPESSIHGDVYYSFGGK